MDEVIKLGCVLPANRKISLSLPFVFEPPIKLFNGIGENCKFGAFSYSVTPLSNLTLGRYCSVGHAVEILSDHPTTWLTSSVVPYQPNVFQIPGNPEYTAQQNFESFKPIILENDVWVGGGVRFRGGVKIGTGAIIAAGAVVTKDVPPYAIVGGVPARIIKYRFDQKTIAALLESRWWEYNLLDLQLDVKNPLVAIEQLQEAIAKGKIQKYQPQWIELIK